MNTRSGVLRIVSAIVGAGLVLSACGSQDEVDAGALGISELRVGLIPNIAPEEQRARYAPFGEYLSEQLDIPVELFVASDYAGVVTALANGQLDMAYLGGLTYLQANEQVELVPLVTEVDRETKTTEYYSAIVVPADSPLQTLEDLLNADAVLALGDVASTSGSLYPRSMIVDAGATCSLRQLDSCPPLRQVVFTGGHDAAAQAVLSGSADAAGMELRILHRLERDGAVPVGALRVIAQAPVEGYPWVLRSALGEPAEQAIRNVFLALDDPELLDLLRAESYVAATPDMYQDMRGRAEAFGFLSPTS
ncbi:MAG: phosphate/phosphite/phosphonate ABC transporter substrate-binding protein [Nitriliruptoraceae bacterium]